MLVTKLHATAMPLPPDKECYVDIPDLDRPLNFVAKHAVIFLFAVKTRQYLTQPITKKRKKLIQKRWHNFLQWFDL